MAPILIDNRDLVKLGLTSILIIVLTFAGGYQFGQKQATLGFAYQIDRTHESIMVPGVNEDHVANKESQKTESLATEEVDNDLKKVVEENSAEIDQKKITQPFKTISDQSTHVVASSTGVELEYKVDKVEKKAPDIKETSVSNNAIGQSSGDYSSRLDTSSSNKSNDNKIKFSIQVAVYGRLKNAEKMVKILQEKNLEAYVSDYTNKKNKRRFNVRIGYFKEKKTALDALKHYIDVHKGDGYLVNYSKESIVNIALEQTVNKEKTKDINQLNSKLQSASDKQVKTNQTNPNGIPITNGSSDNIIYVETIQTSGESNPDRVENISVNIHK